MVKTKKENEKYGKIKRKLCDIALKFRCSDMEFSEFSIEDKKMLNDVGKIIGYLCFLLLKYEYTNEEEKLEIRRNIVRIRSCIEKVLDNMK